MSTSKNFRPDINGLRAWAVIAVVLYHFEIPGFQSGFVGVDIFFVISGFLMTGIILEKIKNHPSQSPFAFPFRDFYLARARRILPALIFLISTQFLIFSFLFSSEDYRKLAKHAFGAIFFISNFLLNNESGYFDTDSHEKLLLHTWSLSTEWQFYLILPILLIFFIKISRNHVQIIGWTLLLCTISFALSVIQTPHKPEQAFFLLHTRAWEMLAGGLVYLLGQRNRLHEYHSRALNHLGYVILAYSIFFIDPQVQWPGWMAIFPVLGTALVIFSGQTTSFYIQHNALQWIGKISYSIYLWHWPLCALLYITQHNGEILFVLPALLLSVMLGWLSWRWIEVPSQKMLRQRSEGQQTLIIMAALLALAAVCTVIYKSRGLPGRLPESIEKIAHEQKNRNPRFRECHKNGDHNFAECTYGGKELGVIVIGDSHAASIVRTVEKALPSSGLHVLDWTFGGCPTIFDLQSTRNSQWGCRKLLDHIKKKSSSLPAHIPLIISNRYSVYLLGANEKRNYVPNIFQKRPWESFSTAYQQEVISGYRETICHLAQQRKVYLLSPVPEMVKNVPNAMYRSLSFMKTPARISITTDDYLQRQQATHKLHQELSKECQVNILDVAPYFCEDNYCWGDKKGMPIYYDDNHLSERGAALLLPEFQKIFAN